MDVSEPRVSVITVCFNSEDTIEDTFVSIKNQSYPNIEYIVIDGGSSDSTLHIVDKYKSLIDIFVSERDRGIGDAWNKGVLRASGELIFILNADDEIFPDSISNMVRTYLSHDRLNAIYFGNTQFIDQGGSYLALQESTYNRKRVAHGFGFMFTTCFFPRSVWSSIGEFSINYSIAVDTEWLVRAINADIPIVKSQHVIKMRTGGVSDLHKRKAFSQYHSILRRAGYSRLSLLLPWIRHELILSIKGPRIGYWITQLAFITVSIQNLLLNISFFHSIRKFFAGLFRLKIAEMSYIHSPVRFFSIGKFSMGGNSVINRNCYIDNRDRISIGRNVSIAHDVKIYTAGHSIDSPDFIFQKSPVAIDDYAVIFSNCLIMPGVNIGYGAVVLPGSVVTKNVDPLSVVGGNPARHIRYRKNNLRYNLNYGYWMSP